MSANQVASFVFRESPVDPGAAEYLAVHRTPDNGDLWQPVTGDVVFSDAQNADAAARVVYEKLGLAAVNVVSIDHSFRLTGGTCAEYSYGVQVDSAAQPELGPEHDARLWVPRSGMSQLVEYHRPDHVIAVTKVNEQISEQLPNVPEHIFSEDSYSFIIVKPDAYELGIDQEVMDRLASRGLSVVASLGAVQLCAADVDKIWHMPQQKTPWYHATAAYMSRRPVDMHLIQGPDASTHAQAVKAELRAEHDRNHRDNHEVPIDKRVESIMHCSDRMEELARQSVTFFGASELIRIVEDRLYATER